METQDTTNVNNNTLKILSFIAILWFTFVFGVERIDYNGSSIINLSNAVYIVVVVIGSLLLLISELNYIPLIFLLPSSVLALFGVEALIGSFTFQPFLHTVESLIVVITTLLVHILSEHLQTIEKEMESITLPQNEGHILESDLAIRQAKIELQSLRRNSHSLTVLYTLLSSSSASVVNQPEISNLLDANIRRIIDIRKRQVRLGQQILALTNLGDIIFEYRNGIVICLLETNRQEAEVFIYRLYHHMKTSHEFTLWVGLSEFPNDGDTFDTLLQQAVRNIKVYEHERDETLDQSTVRGDARISLNDRVKFAQKSDWVDRLPNQSETGKQIYKYVKRAMDIVLALILLIFLFPLLAVVALAIFINDGRPIFYAQDRVGHGGKIFKMYKFRSMYQNAPPLQPVLVKMPDGTFRQDWPDKNEDDPRIFSVGRFIRKWSIDELPQLWNVVKGDLSLVGPRPSSRALADHTLFQTARLTMKPGITGLWQVSDRSSKIFDERILWDMKYAQKFSLWLDLLILLKTFRAVIRKTGV